MHDSRQFRFGGWFWLGLCMLGSLAGLARAQPNAPPRVDPVVALRDQLKTPIEDSTKKEELAARQRPWTKRSGRCAPSATFSVLWP